MCGKRRLSCFCWRKEALYFSSLLISTYFEKRGMVNTWYQYWYSVIPTTVFQNTLENVIVHDINVKFLYRYRTANIIPCILRNGQWWYTVPISEPCNTIGRFSKYIGKYCCRWYQCKISVPVSERQPYPMYFEKQSMVIYSTDIPTVLYHRPFFKMHWKMLLSMISM